jgi:hypothetical protein
MHVRVHVKYPLYLTEFSQTEFSRQIFEKYLLSLPYSQVPATCPYPEPTPSSPHDLLQLPEGPT